MADDPYAVLGVSRTASADEIRRAYYKGAVKCHPDKYPDDLAALARFHTLSEAHAVLADATSAASAKGHDSGATARGHWESYFVKVFGNKLDEMLGDSSKTLTNSAANPEKAVSKKGAPSKRRSDDGDRSASAAKPAPESRSGSAAKARPSDSSTSGPGARPSSRPTSRPTGRPESRASSAGRPAPPSRSSSASRPSSSSAAPASATGPGSRSSAASRPGRARSSSSSNVLGKAPSGSAYGSAPGARPKLAEAKSGPKPSRKKTGNEQLDEAVAMLLILVDSVAKAGPGDRPVLDEALGLLTAVEEYATATAAAAQAQLQNPDAKKMLDGLKGNTKDSQASKGDGARVNLDSQALKLLAAASVHLEVLGKFADADPQVRDIVAKLKDIAAHLEQGKNQYREVVKKAGATKVGIAVKKEKVGLKAQASKLKSAPKAAGKQVKAAIAEARSKPLLKTGEFEILETKGSELVQAVTRKIKDNLVKNQAEQWRQAMERQAMVESELGGSIPVSHGVVDVGPGSPGGGTAFGPGSSTAAVQGPGGVVVRLELGPAAVQTLYELVQLDSAVQGATRGRQYQLDIASNPETAEARKERRERLGTFWKEGLENDETVDAACRRAFAHVPEGPDRDRLEETLNGLGKARGLPLTVVDAEWKQFLQDADMLQKQVLRAKMAVFKMKDDPGSRSQFDKLYEESMRSNDTVDQFASKAVAALAPDESAKFELLLKKLLAGRSLMSLQRVDKLRQQCLAAELVRRVLFDASLREKLASEVPGFWSEASASGQTLENFWIRVLALVVPDGKDRYFFEEAAIKGILGGWDILLKVPIQELEGVPEFQKFMASGGGDVLIMILKEPLIIPFMLLLCFPPIAAVLLFCAPILFPLVLLNVLKLMTFTSSTVWKEGVETGKTLEHLLVQAVRMYPDQKMAEKVEKTVLKALGPAAKCTLRELECIQMLCERSWATIFDPDHAETRGLLGAAYANSIDKMETIAAFGSRVLDLLVTDKSDRKIFDSYMRKNVMAQQLPLMMLEIERQSFLGRIGLQMEQAFPDGNPEHFLKAIARRAAATVLYSEYGQTQVSPPWRNFLMVFASNAHYYDGYTGQLKPAVRVPSIEEQTMWATQVLNHDQTVLQIQHLSRELSGVFAILEAPFEAVRVASNFALKALNMSKEMGTALISSLASFDINKFVDDAERAVTDKEARQRLADSIKDAVLEFLLEYLPSMPIPMIEGEGDGLLYTISHLSFSQLKIRKEDVKVTIYHDDDALPPKLTVTATNISSMFRGLMWSYKQTYFPYMEAGGACDADVTGVDVSMSFDYHPQRVTASGTIGPWITLEQCNAKIHDIKMEMSETSASASGDWGGVASGWFHSNMAALSKDNIKIGVTRSLIATLKEIAQDSVLPPLNNMLGAAAMAQKGAKVASKIIKRQSSKLRPKNSKKQLRILMVGLEKSGKLEILQRLNLGKGKVVHHVATPGFDVDGVNRSLALLGHAERMDETLEVWDVGGHYYAKTRGLVFVLDATDLARVVLAKVELARVLYEDGMRESQLLVWAHRPAGAGAGATSVDELAHTLGLHQLTERQWHVQPCSAETGEGLKEGLDWLGMNVSDLQTQEEKQEAAANGGNGGSGGAQPASPQTEGPKSPKPKASQRKTRPKPAPSTVVSGGGAGVADEEIVEAEAGEDGDESEPKKDLATMEKEKAESEAQYKAWAATRREAVEEGNKRREGQSEGGKALPSLVASLEDAGDPSVASTKEGGDEAPADEAPADETPPEEAPADELPADEAPPEEAPADEVPNHEAPPEEAPADEAPADTDKAPNDEPPDGEVPATETYVGGQTGLK